MLDLKPFCCKDPVRETLATPWNSNGWTYASNGHIAIRVSQRDCIVRTDGPNVDRVWAALLPCENYEPLPDIKIPADIAEPGECETCGGSTVAECCECGQDRECPDCDEGISREPEMYRVEVAPGLFFKARYYVLMRSLPNLVCDLRPAEEKPRCRHFKFDGGEGIIMPMFSRAEHQTYILRPKKTEAA